MATIKSGSFAALQKTDSNNQFVALYNHAAIDMSQEITEMYNVGMEAIKYARELSFYASSALMEAEALRFQQQGSICIGNPIFDIPDTIDNSTDSIQFHVAAHQHLDNVKVVKFLLSSPDLGLHLIEFTATNDEADLSVDGISHLPNGHILHISVIAIDALGNHSRATTCQADIVGTGIQPPLIVYPSANSVVSGVFLTPKIQPFSCVGCDDEAKSVRIQLSTDREFTDIVYDSGDIPVDDIPYLDNIEILKTYFIRAVYTGGVVGPWGSPTRFTIGDANVVGVAQTTTGVAGRTFMRIDRLGEELRGTPNFNKHPVYAGIVERRIDGQDMVGIPRCFIKRELLEIGQLANCDARFISDMALPGYELHPAFLAADGVTPMDMIWIGKYQAGSQTVDGVTMLASIPGVYPYCNQLCPTYKQLAEARNRDGVSGFHMLNVHEYALIAQLILTEIASTNTTGIIGTGLINGTNNSSYVDNTVVSTASWRGLVGLWGNVWSYIDKIKVVNTTTSAIDMGDGVFQEFALSSTGKYIYPDVILGYTEDTKLIKHLFIGDITKTAASEYIAAYKDKQYTSTDKCTYFCVGGSCGMDIRSAGLFNFYAAQNVVSKYIGTRIAKWEI